MKMSRTKKIRILEFAVIGVIFGTIEDLLAVSLATDASIDFKVIWIVVAVAIPFAFVSEIIVDHPRFWAKIWPETKELIANVMGTEPNKPSTPQNNSGEKVYIQEKTR